MLSRLPLRAMAGLACTLVAACTGESPLADGAGAASEDAALVALRTAFLADDCAEVARLASGFRASSDVRLHAVTTMYGRCALAGGDVPGAIDLLARVAYVERADAWVASALYWLGRARLEGGDAAGAVADLARFGARFAHHVHADDALLHLGRAQRAAGDLDAALITFADLREDARASASRRAAAVYESGVTLVERAAGDPASPDLEAAYGWFDALLRDSPDSYLADNATYRRGRVRYDQGRWAEAETLLVAGLAAWPTSTWRAAMGYVLGRARYELGELAAALEGFAITLGDAGSTYHDNALYYSGRVWYRLAAQGDPERFATAIPLFERVLDEHPDSSYGDDAAYFSARASYQLGDLTKAEPAFARIPAGWPTSPYVDNAWYYLVYVRVAQDDCPGARAALAALVAAAPTSSYRAPAEAFLTGSSCAGGTP